MGLIRNCRVYDNLAYQTFIYPNDWLDRPWASEDYKTTRKVGPAEGTELSTLQSLSFIVFLIDEYSLDYVLSYLKDNVSFKNLFEMTIWLLKIIG